MGNVPLCPHDQQPRVVVVVGLPGVLVGGWGGVISFLEEPGWLLDEDEKAHRIIWRHVSRQAWISWSDRQRCSDELVTQHTQCDKS